MRELAIVLVFAAVPALAERTVSLDDLDPPVETPAYREWLAEQSTAVRKAIAKNCATSWQWERLCNGIGPYGLEEPPPRSEPEERAAWEAALTPEQARFVARMCVGPRHLTSPLCGYSLPPPPRSGQSLVAWRRTLTPNQRGMVDEHCEGMTYGTDEYCNGIGPLHLPIPPLRETSQALWDEWYRSLTKAQRGYYKSHCEGEAAAVSQLCGGTPLVVVLDGKPVEYTRARDESRFAIDGMTALRTDWPTARTPWIARDIDGDGAITDGRELFGSGTLVGDQRARDGFEALAALDDNRDGVIDANDRAFGELLLWSDRDGDRRGSRDELVPLSRSIRRISLAPTSGGACDTRGNCERLRSNATLVGDQRAAIVDVQLLVQPPD